MDTKICPNCNAEVPAVANLCKHCFHDFHHVVAKRKSPIFPALFLALATGIVAIGAASYVHSVNRTMRVSVDESTESIVFTTTYARGTTSERVFFKDIASVEYVKNGTPLPFEVAVLTANGARHVLRQAEDPLEFEARKLSERVERPLAIKGELEVPGKNH